MLDNVNEGDSMEDGQRMNHRNFRNFQDGDEPSRGNSGLRNLRLNNPFGRAFVIINDLEDDYLNHYSLNSDQVTNADSTSLHSKSSVSDLNSDKGVLSALLNVSQSDCLSNSDNSISSLDE